MAGGVILGIRLGFNHHSQELAAVLLAFHQQATDEVRGEQLGRGGRKKVRGRAGKSLAISVGIWEWLKKIIHAKLGNGRYSQMLKQTIAITFFASCIVFADSRSAKACADVGHLDGYSKGSTLNEIIEGMNTACPSTITLDAGMKGFAVCENSRYSKYGKTIFLTGSGSRVTAIRRGPNSYGNYCAW